MLVFPSYFIPSDSEMLICPALKSLFWSVLLWVARLHIIRKLREPHVTTLLINCNPSVVSIPCHNKSSCVRFPNLNVSQAMHKLELLLPKDPRIELGPKNTIITASRRRQRNIFCIGLSIGYHPMNPNSVLWDVSTGCFFSLGLPPKKLKYGRLDVSRTS